jgi:2-polyprenyl-3-methyl-5-hydroxy-6-metoxy-1,4-benzoquinol methylase
MSDRSHSSEMIREALSLDGTPEKIRRFYARWAPTYDADLASEQYVGPQIMVEAFESIRKDHAAFIGMAAAEMQILDAGCGTGLIGSALAHAGYRRIDGFDLSHEMVAIAAATGCYRTLQGGIDMNLPLRHVGRIEYDAALCCGVFTLGHVPPSSLQQLVDVVRPGGLILVSTRVQYYDESDYQRVSDEFEDRGVLKLIRGIKDASHTTDGRSHYWIYEVIG